MKLRHVIVVLIAALCWAVPSTAGAADGVIRVTVTFQGRPLANMVVIINNSASNPNAWNNFNIPNTTDGQGHYEVSVPPGAYDVHIAEPAPHNNETYGSQVLYDVGVGDGAGVDLGFELDRPWGTITGNVRDGGGNPVGGAKVEAFGSFALGDQPPYGWGDTFTDGNGNFRIQRLLPNRWYVVFVSALGYRMDQVPVVAGAVTPSVNFPGATYAGPGPQGGAAGGGGGPAPAGSLPTLGGDVPLTGDWDGNGAASIGVKRGGLFFLRNSVSDGFSDVAFGYGNPDDLGLAGDWDGSGGATPGVWRHGTFVGSPGTELEFAL